MRPFYCEYGVRSTRERWPYVFPVEATPIRQHIKYCAQSTPLVEYLLLKYTIIAFKYLTLTCRTHTCLVSEGNALGQFSYPHDVAINSNGVVYVADNCNHRVQLFSDEGQFISSFGSEGSQYGQLYYPHGICVDSTNTVYVTDWNDHVHVSVH